MLFSVPTTVAGCSVKRLIHPTVLCSGPVGLIRRVSVASGTECRMRRERLIRPTVQGLDLVGPIRRASVASGTECRMRRERLIRPTVLCLDLVGLIRGVSVASGKKRQRTKQTQPHLASNL
ncbi:hypothetical protein HMPREF1591_02510 [Escherichia coli 113303]|nr:hypothetical protein HMPREF1591_02510 [Escherichia coli 113303]